MTPPERAAYLIKELGYKWAIAHANWVIKDCEKKITREYWEEVLAEIKKYRQDFCLSCGYCKECRPEK